MSRLTWNAEFARPWSGSPRGAWWRPTSSAVTPRPGRTEYAAPDLDRVVEALDDLEPVRRFAAIVREIAAGS